MEGTGGRDGFARYRWVREGVQHVHVRAFACACVGIDGIEGGMMMGVSLPTEIPRYS